MKGNITNIVITGSPGVGKTTLVKRILDELNRNPGIKGGGFYTKEIRDNRIRQGFLLVTLEGSEIILAHVDVGGADRVGKYGVDVRGLERVGVGALEQALKADDIVVIDEIGKMELFSKRFQQVVQTAFDSDKVVLSTLGKIDHLFVRAIKSRQDIHLFEIDRGNRDRMKDRVVKIIRETLKE